MATYPWRAFLEQYSRELLADRSIRAQAPEEVRASGWMGYAPATQRQLRELEDRIGVRLPDSFREFLATSNGWRQSGGFIYDVWPTTKVEWFRVNNRDWIDAYQGMSPVSLEEHCDYGPHQNPCLFRAEYMKSALLITDVGDSAVYLLNPEVKSAAGEWEAWFFANWAPGATRYRSFWELMQAEHQSFVQLREREERRYFPEDGIESLPTKLPGLIRTLAEKVENWKTGSASIGDPHVERIIDALAGAETKVLKIAQTGASPKTVLNQLTELAAELEHEWKSSFRPNLCVVDAQSGWAEGNREATGIVRWFLNQPPR